MSDSKIIIYNIEYVFLVLIKCTTYMTINIRLDMKVTREDVYAAAISAVLGSALCK